MTQVLFLAQAHQRGFQPGPKGALHLQARGWLRPDPLAAVRAGRLILPDSHHLGAGRWQFDDLVDFGQLPGRSALRVQLQHLIGSSYPLALMLLVSFHWSVLAPAALVLRFLAFLIPRRRLR